MFDQYSMFCYNMCISVAFAIGDIGAVGTMELRGNSALESQVTLHAVEVWIAAKTPRALVAVRFWEQHNCQNTGYGWHEDSEVETMCTLIVRLIRWASDIWKINIWVQLGLIFHTPALAQPTNTPPPLAYLGLPPQYSS